NLESMDVKIFIEDCEARYINEREFKVTILLLIALKKACKKCEYNLISGPCVDVEILSTN
ncbi:hypothetical protein, partial [Clostridium sp.]|uniref:hypothetical protein n=1 Tax=Clostridium sp. TaxID=1506 RepID=UPI0025C66F22